MTAPPPANSCSSQPASARQLVQATHPKALATRQNGPAPRQNRIGPSRSTHAGQPSLDPSGRRRTRRRGLLLLVTLLAASWCPLPLGADEPETQQRPAVSLTIDFGDGFQKRYPKLSWQTGMNVLDAMRLAQAHPRGTRFTYRGSGATAFLTQIDDLKNEGAGRNWVFRVNDQLGDRSFAIVPLEAGDEVLWRFEKYRAR